jgi:hypothetical protein
MVDYFHFERVHKNPTQPPLLIHLILAKSGKRVRLLHADGKLTKNDKSYYFDVTGHVIASVDNMTNKNRPRVFDKLDYGFNVGINRKLKTIRFFFSF